MRVDGTVVGGRGLAGPHIEEIADAIAPLLDAPPIAGTLNIVLDQPAEFSPYEAALAIQERFFWNASINGLPCLAYRWYACPLHVVEMVASVHFRSRMSLVDGSAVTIDSPSLERVSPQRHREWNALWGEQSLDYYTTDVRFPEGRKHRRRARHAGQRPPRKRSWLMALGLPGIGRP
jgi:hypothetical protein